MNSTSSFQPKWASAPGDTLADILDEKKISLSSFANMMESTGDFTKELLQGYILITEEVALRLENVLGTSAQFWITREAIYRASIERLRHTEEQKWLKEIPVDEMLKNDWLDNTRDIIKSCLDFFDVPDVWAWRRKYRDISSYVAFRKSSSLKSTTGALAAWIRQGEIKSSEIECSPWNKDKLKNSLLEMRSFSKKKSPKHFIPELRRICSECGIALVVSKTPNGCSASGATKFISVNKAMILLSFRYLVEDHFWFTFFHEIGHLILHDNALTFVDEEEEGRPLSTVEAEANDFSSQVLIPEQFQKRLRTMQLTEDQFKTLAKDADISLGIIVGQLQHLGRLEFKRLNSYKRRYKWEDILQVS